MAEPDAPSPDAVSSYSDPVYDRLEAMRNSMAKRWPLLVAIFIVTVIVVVGVRTVTGSSEEAAASQALIAARKDGLESLITLSKDDTISKAYRVRAANEAATLLVKDGKLDEALNTLGSVKALAREVTEADPEGSRVLTLSLALGEGHILEQQGALDEALEKYDPVSQATKHPGLAHAGSLGLARTMLLQADAKTGDEATTLRKEAIDILDELAENSSEMGQVARFLKLKTELHHPELTGVTPVPPALPKTSPKAAPNDKTADKTAADLAADQAKAAADAAGKAAADKVEETKAAADKASKDIVEEVKDKAAEAGAAATDSANKAADQAADAAKKLKLPGSE